VLWGVEGTLEQYKIAKIIQTGTNTMLKRVATLTALVLALHTLSACMYYADFDRKRADTEQTRQKTSLIEAYAACLKVNATEPERCPKPNY
jgi:hypothetical protein